jgi:hypothetical protein
MLSTDAQAQHFLNFPNTADRDFARHPCRPRRKANLTNMANILPEHSESALIRSRQRAPFRTAAEAWDNRTPPCLDSSAKLDCFARG